MHIETTCFADGAWRQPLPRQLDASSTLVLAFGASNLIDNRSAIDELLAAMPKSVVLGCSTAGEILNTEVRDDTLTVAVARFGKSTLRKAEVALDSAADSFAAGRELAGQFPMAGLKGVFVISDGLGVNGSELVRGFNEVLPSTVCLTGGLAGDGPRFQRTWVLAGGKPTGKFVTAVGFYGDAVRMNHGSKGGWDPFGVERRVTRAQGNVLYELDGAPALDLYKTYLGDRAAGLPATALLFPLAIRADLTSEKQLVRTILAIDENDKSMTFAGDVPEGSLAQLMRANFDRLIEGASSAAGLTADRERSGPCLAIAVSCVGRRLVLGERAEEEVEATMDALPSGAQQVGFYSYGEISPHGIGACDLHNQTMTLTTVSED